MQFEAGASLALVSAHELGLADYVFFQGLLDLGPRGATWQVECIGVQCVQREEVSMRAAARWGTGAAEAGLAEAVLPVRADFARLHSFG